VTQKTQTLMYKSLYQAVTQMNSIFSTSGEEGALGMIGNIF